MQTIKSKQGQSLVEKAKILERWEEYVEDVYKDEKRGKAYVGDLFDEVYTICSGKEIEEVIKDLPKGKACGNDNIAAELLQSMGKEEWR